MLVSLLMTVFELLFYRLIIEPETTKAVKSILDAMENGIYEAVEPRIESFSGAWVLPLLPVGDSLNIVESFLKTNTIREDEIIQKLNNYAYITGAFMLFLVFGLMYVVHTRLTRLRTHKHVLQIFGPNYGAAILTSLLTVFLLASFQYIFYLFGRQFKFVGLAGIEELRHSFNNMLRKEFGMQEVGV